MVHLEHKDRVADISDIKGGWWVELKQMPDRKVREELFHTKGEVVREIRDWLK